MFTHENYELAEPHPLGFTNVMFCFLCLTAGIGLALCQVLGGYSIENNNLGDFLGDFPGHFFHPFDAGSTELCRKKGLFC